MKEITLTVDGKQVKGKEGDTILDVCQANDIDVPTLCHLKGLSNVGACRMCVVDIEGERRINPSCTYPARDGLVVQTKTETLERYRRLMLELMFTERNHFCMFCERSSDCDLQKMAYRYQMDNVRYPYTFPSQPLDPSTDSVAIDHNRCILCGRCVRICAEIEANHTLDFSRRGWKTVVAADLGQPLAESSCTLCGACMQVCPTGAIFSKLSIYKGKPIECEEIATICPICGVGCEMSVLIKDNNVILIRAPEPTKPRGSLCREGRFGLIRDGRLRVTSPLLRDRNGRLRESAMAAAMAAAAARLKEIGKGLGGVVSPRLPGETLLLFDNFMRDVIGSDWIDTSDGKGYRVIAEGIKQFHGKRKGLDIECTTEEILEADCILLVGADPLKTHPVAAALIRRAMDERKAKLIVINTDRDVFPLWSTLWLKPRAGTEGAVLSSLSKSIIDNGLVKTKKTPAELIQSQRRYWTEEAGESTSVDPSEIDAAAKMYGQAKSAVIIYGQGLLDRDDPNLVTLLLNLADLTANHSESHLRVISLKPYSNSRGAWDLGIADKEIPRDKVNGLYLLLGDEQENDSLLRWLRGTDFLMVQASYQSAITSMADIVLPSPTWAEREPGEYISMDGTIFESQAVLQPAKGLLQDREILVGLSRKLGHTLTPR
jgi:formate dehydrogenase major subunit